MNKNYDDKRFKNYIKNIGLNYYTLCGYLFNVLSGLVNDNYKTIFFERALELSKQEYAKHRQECLEYLAKPDPIRDQEDIHDYGKSYSQECEEFLAGYKELIDDLDHTYYEIIVDDDWSNNNIEVFACALFNYLDIENGEKKLEEIEEYAIKKYEESKKQDDSDTYVALVDDDFIEKLS